MKTSISSLVIVAACGLFAVSAFAGATVLKAVQVGGLLPSNECTGEAVNLAGTAHVVLHKGNLHLKISDVTATGVDTGRVWTSKSVSTQNQTSAGGPNGATVTTTTIKIQLQSGDDSFKSKITAHTTENANGDITVDFFTETFDCQ